MKKISNRELSRYHYTPIRIHLSIPCHAHNLHIGRELGTQASNSTESCILNILIFNLYQILQFLVKKTDFSIMQTLNLQNYYARRENPIPMM